MHWLPIQSIANAFHRNGIDTIAMDTYGLIADGVAAAGGGVEGGSGPSGGGSAVKPQPGLRIWPSVARQTTVETPACAPLAHARSPRDNYTYRASFAC